MKLICTFFILSFKERILRLNMEELFEFFQGSIAQDFGYDDDRVIESLQEAMEELKRAKLDIPPGGDNPPERPTRPFGVFEPPTIEDLISRMSVPAINSDEDYRAQTLRRNRPSIPADGGRVFVPSPMMQRLSRLSSSAELSLLEEGSELLGDETSSRASGHDCHSSQTSVADDMSDIGSVSFQGDAFGSNMFVPSLPRSEHDSGTVENVAAHDSAISANGKVASRRQVSEYEKQLDEALESMELESWDLLYKKLQEAKTVSVPPDAATVDNGQNPDASSSLVTNPSKTLAESSSVEESSQVKSSTDAASVPNLVVNTPLSVENVEAAGNISTVAEVLKIDTGTGARTESQANAESKVADIVEPAINEGATDMVDGSNNPIIEENTGSTIKEAIAKSILQENCVTNYEKIVQNTTQDSNVSEETDSLEKAKHVTDEDVEIKHDRNVEDTTRRPETKSNENVKTRLPVKLRIKFLETKETSRQENSENRSQDAAKTDDQEIVTTKNQDSVRIWKQENGENGSVEGWKTKSNEKSYPDPVLHLPESPVVQKQRSRLPISQSVQRLIPMVHPKPGYKQPNSPNLLPKVPPKPTNPLSPKTAKPTQPNDEVTLIPNQHLTPNSPKVEKTKDGVLSWRGSKKRPPTVPKKNFGYVRSPVATQLPILHVSRTATPPTFADGCRDAATDQSPFAYSVSGSVFYADPCCTTPATGTDPQTATVRGASNNSAAGSVPKTSYR